MVYRRAGYLVMVGVMMAALGKGDPAFVSYEVGGNFNTGTLSINDPTDWTSSDLNLAFYGANNTSARTWTAPGSWTERLDQGARPSIGVSTRTGGELGSQGWTISTSTSGGYVGVRLRFRTAIYDTIGSVATTTSNSTLSLPGITASRGLLLACFFLDNGDSGLTAPGTTSAPTGFSTIYDDRPSGVTGTPMRISIYSKAVSAGATGDIDTTIASIGSGTAAGVLIGLA